MDFQPTTAAPTSLATEEAVGRSWEQILGVPADQGDRLLDVLAKGLGADRSRRLGLLLSEIDAKTGVTLPLTVAFASPTAAQLTEMVRRREWPAYVRPVRIKSAPGQALFVLPGLGALGFDVVELLRYLSFPGSIYLCPPRGIDGQEPDHTLEATVADHVAAIKTVQPNGPYWMLGYSWGGVVALEIARALRASGDKVAFVGMIDPVVNETNWPYRAWLGYLANRVRHHIQGLRQHTSLRSAFSYAKQRFEPLIGRTGRWLGSTKWQPLATEADTMPTHLRALWKAELEVIEAYRVRTYDGKVTCFAMRYGHAAMCNPKEVWGRKVRQLDLRWLPADHYFGPSAEKTADMISTIMAQSNDDAR